MTAPATPSRRSGKTNDDCNKKLSEISQKWDLQLDIPTTSDSPSRRMSRTTSEVHVESQKCVAFLKRLYWRDGLEAPIRKFNAAAWQESRDWIYGRKDVSHSGVIGPLSPDQRFKLLRLLAGELEPEVKRKNGEFLPQMGGLSPRKGLDIQPVPQPIFAKPKRKSDEHLEWNSACKKSKIDQTAMGKTIDDVPVSTRKTPNPGSSSKKLYQGAITQYAATKPPPRPEFGSIPSTDSSNSTTSDSSFMGAKSSSSANTSFCSDTVKGPRDGRVFQPVDYVQLNSQSFDDDFAAEDFATLFENTPLSAAVTIKERLEGIFPTLPKCLERAPLGIRYEVARVFLHTEVDISCLDQYPMPDSSKLRDYEALWQWLKTLPALNGKRFPQKSDSGAWEMSLGTFHAAFKRVNMTGALHLNDSTEGPLFNFKLNPLQRELSFRLGRRFGHDRFIEISIPVLEDARKVPKKLAPLLQAAGESGRNQISEWVNRGLHEFLGRTWECFYVKDRSKKKPGATTFDDDDLDALARKKICFFATTGIDFEKRNLKTISPKDDNVDRRSDMTVQDMLNWLLSLKKNGNQSFLKFYSRISLGLSNTYPTVVLKPNQIKKKRNDILSPTKEVMNDGCGLISPELAKQVSEMLGLNNEPSAFQGRIGEAKGLWIVDYSSRERPDKIWIETYPSQRKWERVDSYLGLSEERDEDHRTFEVLKCSSSLKSAALTTQFLPLLEDRGVHRDAISRLLINGLTYEMGQMVSAIQNPQSFRKWLREHSPSVSERLKTGVVPFKAGRPESPEEALNMLLDAGFDPKKFGYARDVARKIFRSHCDRLKEKLNIKVGLSLYAYIAVDFERVLQPNEIHICFSTPFHDEMSNQKMLELDGMDVLIARSPAHFVSDIQKVRAVFKPELRRYKDVVILPTTGDSPLAGLLSGGDYDGDTVWLCFDPEIVKNFENGTPPKQPDLLKPQNSDAPFVRKIDTKFSEFSPDGPYSFNDFLQKSFDFNFKISNLGMCTNHKERVSKDERTVSSKKIVYLSTLLSYLVDQNKQGYEFNPEDWSRLKTFLSKGATAEGRKGVRKQNGQSVVHVIDYLKAVAEKTTENVLTDYHMMLEKEEYFDEDLVKCADDFSSTSQTSEAHKALLEQLKRDLVGLKDKWISLCGSSNSQDESKASFTKNLTLCFDQWQDIQPIGEEWLKNSLTQKSWCHYDHSQWALLKASLLFQLSPKSAFPWWMACRQLCQLKCMATGTFNSVTPAMFAMLRPDSGFVKMRQNDDLDPKFQEAKREVEVFGDEDDNEFDIDSIEDDEFYDAIEMPV